MRKYIHVLHMRFVCTCMCLSMCTFTFMLVLICSTFCVYRHIKTKEGCEEASSWRRTSAATPICAPRNSASIRYTKLAAKRCAHTCEKSLHVTICALCFAQDATYCFVICLSMHLEGTGLISRHGHVKRNGPYFPTCIDSDQDEREHVQP